jgi:hypothetical protein
MRQCPECGIAVLPGWSFCPSCNRDLRILPSADDLQLPASIPGMDRSPSDPSKRCRNCGHLNPEHGERCEACDFLFTSYRLKLDSPVVISMISIFAILVFVFLSLPGGLFSGQQHNHQLPPSAGVVPVSGAGLNTSSISTTTMTPSLPIPVVSATIIPSTSLLAPVPSDSGAAQVVRQPVVATSIALPTPGTQVPVIPPGLPNASSLVPSITATSTGTSVLPSPLTSTPSVTPISSMVVTIPVPANGHQTGQLAWAGTGNYASDFFTLSPGEVRLSVTADTSSGVIAEVRDRTGTILGRVSATKSQQDSTILTVPENSTYLVSVTGEGGWTVAVTQATTSAQSQPSIPAVTATVTAGGTTPQLPPTHSSLPVTQGTFTSGGVTVPVPG